MLTEGEVRALTGLRGKQTVSDLTANLERSLSDTSDLVERFGVLGLRKNKAFLVVPPPASTE